MGGDDVTGMRMVYEAFLEVGSRFCIGLYQDDFWYFPPAIVLERVLGLILIPCMIFCYLTLRIPKVKRQDFKVSSVEF